MVTKFVEGTQIKAWGQWSEVEEERGKWEEVSSMIEFVASNNEDGVGGGHVEGREI